jgi:O-acetyl-ADP-ribose deacetylase (regulator of RNase III)
LNETFIEKVKSFGYEAYTMRIEEYKPKEGRKTYYISPANSLCFMDGGIDLALSRIIFPGIEAEVKREVRALRYETRLGRPYLPIGSSLLLDKGAKSLVVAPTMLLPQDVRNTQNAYFSTMAVLYNILIYHKQSLDSVDIVFTSVCCGYGKMSEDESIFQIVRAVQDYPNYAPDFCRGSIVFKEPNLLDQPKLYQNTEWFAIDPKDLVG